MAANSGAIDGAQPVQSASQDAHDSQDVTNVSNPNAQQNVPATACVQNATINVKLSDGRTLIFNTLLTFCVAAMSNALKMNVIQLIVMKFSEDEVVDAKEVLCRNSGNLLTFQVRKDSQYRSEKFVHVEDIYDGLKKLSDTNNLPLFDTDGFGISRLPKIDAEDITNVSIAEKIASFERKFAIFDESMTSILLKSLDNSERLTAVEKQYCTQKVDKLSPLHHIPISTHAPDIGTAPLRSAVCQTISASMSCALSSILGGSPSISGGSSSICDAPSSIPGAPSLISGAPSSISGAQSSISGASLSFSGVTSSISGGPSYVSNDIISISSMTGMSMMPKTTGSQSLAHVCTATTPTVDSSLVSSGTTVSVSQSTDVHTVSSLAVSAEPFVPPGLSTYSNALMTRPPQASHGMHIGDTDQFPQLPVQQMAALAQQLQVPSGASANISK